MMYGDVALLILRVVVGLLFVGHGAQKLLGWFGGKGLAGHTASMERLNVHPARFWAVVSAASEFFGGLGLAFGFLTPLAATALMGAMLVAILKVHWAKGLWNANGGIEFPLVLTAVAFVVGLTGPGHYSLDGLVNLALPEPLTYGVLLAGMLLAVALAVLSPSMTIRRHAQRSA